MIAVGSSTGNDVLYVDGTQVATGNAGSGALEQYRLGSHPSSGNYFNGDICEIVVYNKALSASEQSTINSYVQSTYATSGGGAVTTGGTVTTSRLVRSSDLKSIVLANSNNTTISPTSVSGIAAWYKSDSGITVGSGLVSAWADQSGNGNNLVQNTVSKQPAYGTATSNGLPLITFNGTSTTLVAATNAGITGSAFSIFIAYKPASIATTQSLASFGPTTNGRQFRLTNAKQTLTASYVADVGVAATAIAQNTIYVGALVYTGTSLQFYLNGTADGPAITASTTFSTSSSAITIGSHTDQISEFLNGSIGEVIAYGRAVTADEQLSLSQYLGKRYGVATAATASGTSGTSSSTIVQSNLQTASYTLALSDAGKVIEMNSAANTTVTVPPNSSVAFAVGTFIEVCQIGLGQTNVVAGAGVTFDAPLGTATYARYSTVRLRQRAIDEWVISGGATQYYDPTTITGLVLRMRASTLGITADGASIASAPFEVGGIALSSSGSAQPIWRARGVNGKPYISFDGIDDALSLVSGVPVYNQPVIMSVIAQIRNGIASQELAKMSGLEILLNQTANTWSVYSGSLVSSPVNYGGVMVFTAVFGANGSTGSAQLFTNGVLTGGGSSGGSAGGGDFYLGMHPSTPRFLAADVYEVLVYNQTISAADLNKLHAYVQANYR